MPFDLFVPIPLRHCLWFFNGSVEKYRRLATRLLGKYTIRLAGLFMFSSHGEGDSPAMIAPYFWLQS